jgi:hypothetical protein
MRRVLPLLLIVISVSHAAPADAPSPPVKPYEPLSFTRPAASGDGTYAAFRGSLAVVAKNRIFAELAPLVIDQGFFWARDFGHQFDPHKPAADNLAVAVALESGKGRGWETLAAFAAEPSVEPLPSRPGVICAPARPTYDSVAFSKMLERTYTTGMDWAYPRLDDTPVRTEPKTDAEPIGTLGVHFVRLLGFEGPDSEPAPGRKLWARVELPDGKSGYVPPDSLMSLTAERLCFVKDLLGAWRIGGYIAGGDR